MAKMLTNLQKTWILLGFSLSLLANDPFYFVIRVDDVQSRITWEPRSIQAFQTAVESRSAKVSWAVIPHRLQESQNSDGVLREELLGSIANGHEIIQHGYNHICPHCGQSSHEMLCTQFNVALEDSIQLNLIQNGRCILQDSLNYSPTCFVPPGHVADSQTYEILNDCGFEFLSTTDPLYQNEDHDLFNLPPNNEYTWALTLSTYAEKLQQALDDIELKASLGNYYCLLLHDPFIREGYENGLVIEWTTELLDSLNARYALRIEYATLSEVCSIQSDPMLNIPNQIVTPVKFRLNQNFPNPFNPSTTLRYCLPEQVYVTVTIYDIRGNPVKTLTPKIQTAGWYEHTWNGLGQSGNQVSTGVYFARLEAGELSQTIKMLYLK